MNGTSVAVPQITRAVAELMALSAITGGPAGDRNSIRQLAAQQETPRPQTPSRPATPNEIVGGEGRIITARPGRLPR
jgi:hypothetical protein